MYKEMLISFMEIKLKRLEECINRNGKNIDVSKYYFNDKDKEIIEKWDEQKCKEIYENLKNNINEKYIELSADTCPFCLYFEDELECGYCQYGDNHGVCINHTSDSRKINSYITAKDELTYFSKTWYKRVIEKIEKNFLKINK